MNDTAVEGIKIIDAVMAQYRDLFKRIPMRDIAIWQALVNYYIQADEYDIIVTSTPEEAFERMVADKWTVFMGDDYYGLDYVTIDELVLEYLKKNQLVKDINEEDEDEDE